MLACPRLTMASEATEPSPSLFSMARTKLQSVVGTGVKDSCSLHRWVLLKNSIYRSHPSDVAAAAPDRDDVSYARAQDEAADAVVEEQEVAFMFPDPDAFASPVAGFSSDSENEWLDSLLETLGCEDEDLDADDTEGGADSVVVSVLPVDDDDELLSPLYSPMSSSDDLVDQSSYYINPHAIPIPYPIPYPPLQSPLVQRWLDFDESSALYHDPLPYYDADDVDDLSVPDAIEDTSDDESDAPATPFDHSTSSLVEPASVPPPPERRRRSDLLQPRVYIDTDDSCFYPFELDPIPHEDDPVTVDTARVYRPPLIQEC
ncbi:hypothetical protein FOMPIDRAFT_1039231 [Fomitopsis schrenkii]|uniref:Uncharacterized protein n=1 Tax=Fomitopsis schrenkii TaxID=2126942 RepID=S8ESK2_FOMSC|nr:hypothetical protein FOMPIDRAFT_1039231 [Fomitopsis schrenkii]